MRIKTFYWIVYLARKIVADAQQELRGCIAKAMKMEEKGTIKKLRTTLIDGLVELLECWINYKTFSNPDLAPPFTNKEGAEELLVEYSTDAADSSIFT